MSSEEQTQLMRKALEQIEAHGLHVMGEKPNRAPIYCPDCAAKVGIALAVLTKIREHE